MYADFQNRVAKRLRIATAVRLHMMFCVYIYFIFSRFIDATT